jgi:uncharacterized protein YjbJ (UPF0337 family)
MNDDQVEGTVDKVVGKAQSAAGDLLGDSKTQAEGMARETSGAVQQAIGSAKDAASTAADNLAEILKKIQAQLTDLAAQVKEGAGTAGDVLSDKGKQAVTAVGDQVQESPVASLLVVGAVGYLLGFLSRRN